MPLYEYQCQKCREVSEFLMKISEPDPTSCPKCSEGPLNKLLSQTSFVLKGTGWYETDFKSSQKKKDGGSSGSDSNDNGSSCDNSSTESKTTPKPEKKAESSKPATAKAST